MNEVMFSRVLSFCTVPIETGMPVLLVIACPVTAKVMISIVFPAAGSAGSQRDAGSGAVAGAICRISCVAAIALAGVGVGFVVIVGFPSAPVVAENAVFTAALFTFFEMCIRDRCSLLLRGVQIGARNGILSSLTLFGSD